MPVTRDDQQGGFKRGYHRVKAVADLAAFHTSSVGPDDRGPGGGGAGAPAPAAPAPAAPASPDVDWAASFFGSFGLPPDVAAEVNRIFAQYSDPNAASSAALAYIRGTSWYAQTYPGIGNAISRGIVSNEADYRAMLNDYNQLYHQYYSRDITGDEFAGYLNEGVNLSTVHGRLQGAALASTYGNDWRYALGNFGDDSRPTDEQVKALGEQSAGLDSPIGVQLKKNLDMAYQRLQGVFRGTVASPGFSLNGAGRLTAPGFLGGNDQDVGA